MIAARAILSDRRRRQRGSVLSALLIIVAMLSILVGAVMTELTGAFLISRSLLTRTEREATVTSAVELAIHQLQGGSVPAVCVRDGRGPWFVSLNGSPASVSQTCSSIVPDVATGPTAGNFSVDGLHDTTGGANRYLVGDAAGRLYSFRFGQTAPSWSVAVGGALTAPPLTKMDPSGSIDILVPTAKAGAGCGGHCVVLYRDNGGVPALRCTMPASATLRAPAAVEVAAGGAPNLPNNVVLGDSAGLLQVYSATSGGGCNQMALVSAGGTIIGQPLVFPGKVTRKGRVTTTEQEIFVVTSTSSSTVLREFVYSETSDGDTSLDQDDTQNLAVGGNAVGYAISSSVPTVGSTISLVVAGPTGRLAIGRIQVGSNKSGPTYAISSGQTATLAGAVSKPPYWCHCPGQDRIGVGSTNGRLYLLSSALTLQWTYDGAVDGRPAINSTPGADVNGDWYFGADDGYVYDVELPTSGTQLFKAARFGPGGSIRSSPVVGAASDGCGPGPCLYFGSSTAGSYFVQLGNTRIIELRACVGSTFGSTTCTVNPRLWARIKVGAPAIVGARGVYVQGWSYYSP